MNNIRKDIKEKTFKPFYLIYGDENYLLSFYKNEFKKCFKDDSDMNISILDKDNYKEKDFVDILQKMPFFAEKKLIILDNIKIDNEKIYDVMLENSSMNIILYILNGEVDKRTKLYSFFEKNGYISDMSIQDDETIIKFIKNKFSEGNKNISSKDAMFLISCAGSHLDNIVSEIEKLVAFVGDREEITYDDIDKVVSKSLNDRVFSMIKYINQGDYNKAYDIYGDLVLSDTSSNNAIVDNIIGLLRYNYNMILSYKSLKIKGVSSNEIKKMLSIKDFQLKDIIDVEKTHDEKYYIDKVHKLFEYNKRLRSNTIDKSAVVELLLN